MKYILWIYGKRAFSEHLLPAINNADYSVNIKKELFGINEDYEVALEIMDGEWRFAPSQDYRLIRTDTREEYEGEPLAEGDVFSISGKEGEEISLIVRRNRDCFSVYEKYKLEEGKTITIGKGESNIFSYDYQGLVSAKHARIFSNGNRFVLEDTSANGVFINERRVVGTTQLQFGDCIDIFGLRLVFLEDVLAVSTGIRNLRLEENQLTKAVFMEEEEEEKYRTPLKKTFHRSPRNRPKIAQEKMGIEAPPAPREISAQSVLMTIGPSLTMALPMLTGSLLSIYSSRMQGGAAGVFMYTGLITAIGSSAIGATWSAINMRNARRKNRAEELHRFEGYSEYLLKCTNELKEKYENNRNSMLKLYPEALVCCSYDDSSLELWNRNIRHEDFLFHRLGIGNVPFQVELEIPRSRFSLTNDSLSEKPALIKESYRLLQDVPVCVDLLERRLVGIIGGSGRSGCYPVLHNLAAQVAAANCYTDVKLGFVYEKDTDEAMWQFARWLPHVWSEDKKSRFVAAGKEEASEVFYELTKIFRQRAEEKKERGLGKKTIEKPYYILFLENQDLLEDELISKYIFDTEGNYGLTTVLMVSHYEELPNECEFIIENTAEYTGMYHVADGMEERTRITFDEINCSILEEFARRLSDIEVSEDKKGGEIPGILTFFDMYGIRHPEELEVVERWKKNRTYENIRGLIGQKSGGVDCCLDVHEKYHGPHGLIAGTTGSGKSETLQTYLLSLAINYSPDDVGFFIIDYKGGGMANLFDGLPHMLGQISNLSGNQVRRAMVSIKSENLRRQRIFNEHGVNNINLYTRLYKNNEATLPIPHLFIIIDEFAELKREEPEFMRELISVAQVGRSLGVHLILATQKPSGTVDDNIWSNSKFRLCLRVQDRQDSTDMLHRPDAAYITQAGRGYLQVGNDELFELFQSAWSGAVYDEAEGSAATDIARMLSACGKTALVGSHAKIRHKEAIRRNWIGRLLEVLGNCMENLSCCLKDCLEDSRLKNTLTEEFFLRAEKKGLEYADSEYNRHRLWDLFLVVLKVQQKEKLLEEDMGSLAQKVIERAQKERMKLPEMKEKTQLDAVVEYLAAVAKERGYAHKLQLWLPVLPRELYLSRLEGYEKNSFYQGNWPKPQKGFTLQTQVGMYDDPVNQAQGSFVIDLASGGNHAIVGTVVSGKSTFLLTYLYSLTNRYSPDAVNLYLLDYSSKMLGNLKQLPHTGGVMFEEDGEKIGRFVHMLRSILSERKKIVQGGSYSQYLQANGLQLPVILVVIDNFGAFRAKTNNEYDEFFMTLLKEGIGYGIYLMVTAAGFGLSEIPNRMGDSFRSVICLEMNDKFAYGEALRTIRPEVLPEENVKGRGIARIGESILEFQTALCVRAEDDYKRGEAIRERCETLRLAWKGKPAKPVPEIPENPVWSEFSKLEEVESMLESKDKLPVGYDKKNAGIYGIDLRRIYCYLISGKARTGKTNVLRMAAMAFSRMAAELCIIDFTGSLRQVAEVTGAEYIDSSKKLLEYFHRISPTFRERNLYKKELIKAGRTTEELYDEMQKFPKLAILIDNLPEFARIVHHPGEGIEVMAPFVSTLLEKGAMHNVFWFAGLNQEESSRAAAYGVYDLFVKEKNGMHLGGNVAAQRIFPFDHVAYTEQNKSRKPGIAMLPTHDDDDTNLVVLPLLRTDELGTVTK